MHIDRRLLAALGLSMLIHVMVVSGPGWHLPFLGEPAADVVLEAHLAPKPAGRVGPAPSPSPKPAPKAKAEPRPRPPQPSPVGSTPAPAVAVEAPAPAPAMPEPAAAPVKAEIAWPRQGRIRFVVTRGEGEQGMQLGQSTHAWRHDGETYTLQAVTETTGLVALFREVRIVQSSEGIIGTEGLVPQSFSVERKGKLAEGVRFDWSAGKAALTNGGQLRREVALAAGAQDVLSQIYQIGLAGAAARVEMMIATGKNYGRYAYEAVGDETLATHIGALRTWHVKTPALPGEQAMELWLAQDHGNLPVRIRFVDRKGEVFDQNAVELEADGARLAIKE
jgi:hypothetical protein